MSSKTGNRNTPMPQRPAGRKGAKGPPPRPAPAAPAQTLQTSDRFHRAFCNAVIPALGILSLISLIALLTGERQDDLPTWIDLIYNSVSIGCCVIAFPGMREGKRRGWQAVMTLLALNVVYAVWMAARTLPEARYGQLALMLFTAVFFTILFFYYKKRKQLYVN